MKESKLKKAIKKLYKKKEQQIKEMFGYNLDEFAEQFIKEAKEDPEKVKRLQMEMKKEKKNEKKKAILSGWRNKNEN